MRDSVREGEKKTVMMTKRETDRERKRKKLGDKRRHSFVSINLPFDEGWHKVYDRLLSLDLSLLMGTVMSFLSISINCWIIQSNSLSSFQTPLRSLFLYSSLAFSLSFSVINISKYQAFHLLWCISLTLSLAHSHSPSHTHSLFLSIYLYIFFNMS